MTKPKNKFLTLNLTEQLVGIILLLLVGFLSFFFIYLNNNINNLVNIQIEETLRSSQDRMIESYKRNDSGKFLLSIHDDRLSHKIWDGNEQFQTGNYKNLPTNVKDQINLKIYQQMIKPDSNQSSLFFRAEDSEESFNVVMTVNTEYDFMIASALSDEYSMELRGRLVNGIIRAIFIIVLLIFTLLMAWVTSIIRSLNRIQDYVVDVVSDSDATLEINRHDEIGQVAKALVDMNEELKKQEKVKAELIQNISHDLKTPIATIKSYGESIKDGVYPYDTLEKSVDVIIEHADRLEQKVHSLLLLNRMDYIESISDGSTVDLEEIINKTVVAVIPLNTELEVSVDGQELFFVGEEESWRVVFENILDNALRYAQTYIKIKILENGVEIYNDGKHLTEEVSETMFKAYEKGTDGGFGMGLSIVRKVVDAYGYHVSAENTEDGVVIKISE